MKTSVGCSWPCSEDSRLFLFLFPGPVLSSFLLSNGWNGPLLWAGGRGGLLPCFACQLRKQQLWWASADGPGHPSATAPQQGPGHMLSGETAGSVTVLPAARQTGKNSTLHFQLPSLSRLTMDKRWVIGGGKALVPFPCHLPPGCGGEPGSFSRWSTGNT